MPPAYSTQSSFSPFCCPYSCVISADGSTEDIGVPVEDILAKKPVCAPHQQPMYPLEDGQGGVLVRRRWKTSSPRPQLVLHIGDDCFSLLAGFVSTVAKCEINEAVLGHLRTIYMRSRKKRLF